MKRQFPWKVFFLLVCILTIISLLGWLASEAKAEHLWVSNLTLAKIVTDANPDGWWIVEGDSTNGYYIYRMTGTIDFSFPTNIPMFAKDIVEAVNDTTIAKVVK